MWRHKKSTMYDVIRDQKVNFGFFFPEMTLLDIPEMYQIGVKSESGQLSLDVAFWIVHFLGRSSFSRLDFQLNPIGPPTLSQSPVSKSLTQDHQLWTWPLLSFRIVSLLFDLTFENLDFAFVSMFFSLWSESLRIMTLVLKVVIQQWIGLEESWYHSIIHFRLQLSKLQVQGHVFYSI